MYYISHNNCERCLLNVGVKLFTNDNIKIKNKHIYISHNLLNIKFDKFNIFNKSDYEKLYIWKDEETDRFCFVELENEILIENENCGLDYYFNKVPVYNYRGQLINPRFLLDDLIISPVNDLNKGFNPLLIKILGLRINTPKLDDNVINEGIKNLSLCGQIILKYHYIIQSNNRYSIPQVLYETLNALKVYDYVELLKIGETVYDPIINTKPPPRMNKKCFDIKNFTNNEELLLNCTINFNKINIYINNYNTCIARIKTLIDKPHNIDDNISDIYYDVVSKEKKYKYKTHPKIIDDRLKLILSSIMFSYPNRYYYSDKYDLENDSDNFTKIFTNIKLPEDLSDIQNKEQNTFQVKYLKYKKKYIELKSKLINRLKY